ncbi:MAG: SDR family oxidoreductase [Pseudomonadota bacterium]
MTSSFKDKHVLITGGASGIGRAVSMAFAKEGAKVSIFDINEEYGERTRDEALEAGGQAQFLPVDVSDEKAVVGGVERCQTEFGGVEVLHNHAGTVVIKPFLEMTVADWDRLMAVNVRSMFLVTRAILPGMIDRGRGAVVNTSSVTGVAATALEIAYSVTKGAVHMFTKGIATEFRDHGIRCNAVCPAFVRTEHGMTEIRELDRLGTSIGDGDIAASQGRICEPEEVAPAVLFLAGDQASFINGETLYLDNGLLAKAG